MSIQSIARKLNLETSGSSLYGPSAYGVYEGYRISLSPELVKNTYLVTHLSVVLKDPLSPEAVASLTVSAKAMKKKIQADGKTLRLILGNGNLTYSRDQKNIDIIREWLGTLRRMSLVQGDDCILCEEPGNDRNAFVRGLCVPVHQACYEKIVAEYRSRYQSVETSTQNVGKGYLWAFGGLFLGAIANFIVMTMGFISAWLFALNPFLALLFYNKSGAPKQKRVPFIIGAASLLLGAGLMVLNYAVVLGQAGYTFPQFFALEGAQAEFYGNVAQTLLFSFLGVLVSWGYMMRHSNIAAEKELKDMESKV